MQAVPNPINNIFIRGNVKEGGETPKTHTTLLIRENITLPTTSTNFNITKFQLTKKFSI